MICVANFKSKRPFFLWFPQFPPLTPPPPVTTPSPHWPVGSGGFLHPTQVIHIFCKNKLLLEGGGKCLVMQWFRSVGASAPRSCPGLRGTLGSSDAVAMNRLFLLVALPLPATPIITHTHVHTCTHTRMHMHTHTPHFFFLDNCHSSVGTQI